MPYRVEPPLHTPRAWIQNAGVRIQIEVHGEWCWRSMDGKRWIVKEQILYVQEKDGRWKLNSKISPIDGIPDQWEFKGYFWGHEKTQAYAYFTRMHANCPGARRSRPRGGRWKESYREYYNKQRKLGDRCHIFPSQVAMV